MTTHLRHHIESGQLLYPEQLANALRRQEIYGGSLDTALLELELVDAKQLAEWMHAACGLSPAPASLLARGSERPFDAIDVELMRLGWAIPLARPQSGGLQLAVHPDLPDERLGALFRGVPGLQAMVAPECCLEALRAEWQGSVVPQRYAVLSVAYIGALRADPSITGGASDDAPDEQPERTSRVNETLRYRWEDREALVEDSMTAPPSVPAPPTSGVSDDLSPGVPVIDLPRDDTNPNAAAAPGTPDSEPRPDGADATRTETDRAAEDDAPEHPRSRPPSHDKTVVGPAPAPPTLPRLVGAADRRAPTVDEIVTDGPDSGPLARGNVSLNRTEIVEVPHDHDPRPRARFTAQGTLIDDGPPPGRFDEADLVRRMAGARAVLQSARSRDAAIEAIVAAATVVSPRVAIFRARGAELVGLSTPRSMLCDVGGKVVPMNDGTPIADAVQGGGFAGQLDDPDLALALDLSESPHCLLRRIDVMGRPVLVLYLDNPARAFLSSECEQVDALSQDAADALEAIVRLRRANNSGVPPVRFSDGPATLGTGPHGSWGMPSDRLRAAYGHDDHVAQDAPVSTRAEEEDSVVVRTSLPAEERAHHSDAVEPQFDPNTFADDDDEPAPLPLHNAPTQPPLGRYESGPAVVADDAHDSIDVTSSRPRFAPPQIPSDGNDSNGDPNDAADDKRRTEELAPGLEVARVTDPPQLAPVAREVVANDPSARLTVHSVPPPPPLPPPPEPPEPIEDQEPRTEPSTLRGLPAMPDEPAPDPGPAPSELPNELPGGLPDGVDEEEIISLASPIDQPTARGRIELEAEDWNGPADDASESMVARIDHELTALAAGQGDLRRLADAGDAAYAGLAARLPGPLEVLRRDLRALPPPAAHGPLIRAAIAAGPPVVPHLIELLHHPNPDVRFYAAYIFQELRDDRCALPLSGLAFDVSGDVRVIAMRVLETYSRAEAFDASCDSVRQRLESTDRTERLYAARAVGTLRDVEGIARLIDLLASKDRFIQEAAIESLCSITGQQLGLKPHRWKSWYVDNRERHRIEWIIDSLRHKDMPVRQWAAHELSRITGHRIAFSPVADKRAREAAVRSWTDWWNAEGKARLGADRARL